MRYGYSSFVGLQVCRSRYPDCRCESLLSIFPNDLLVKQLASYSFLYLYDLCLGRSLFQGFELYP